MAAQSTNPARGMRDFLPADVRKREYVIRIIKEVYESYGFEPLETPAAENIETLTGKYGEEGNQLIYKILKRGEGAATGEADLALRYDLTVPLARVVANHKNDLPKFFKRYQIQPVWRADRPARGRYREFYQCDVDTIGSRSMLVEAEQISAVCEILKRLGFEGVVVHLNHRQLLSAILDVCKIPKRKHNDTLIVLDKKDKIGVDAMLEELKERQIPLRQCLKLAEFLASVLSLSAQKLKENITTFEIASKEIKEAGTRNEIGLINQRVGASIKTNEIILERIAGFVSGNPQGEAAIAQLKQILNLTKYFAVSPSIFLNVSLARGLSYYTGAIFEITVGEKMGSLAGGGRYDNLIGMFGKEEIPACGFSLGLERILVVMEERGMFPEHLQNSSGADVMVTIWNEDSIGESLKLASDLRAQGLRVLVYPEADKLGKQFKYADSINIPFVCVLGESELAENKVTLKNMQTGEQETIKRGEVGERISEK